MDLCLLNKDIFFNVLSRFPANILVQQKLVSKGWKHIIEDSDFMCSLMKMGKIIPISGFFFQEKFRYIDTDVEKLSYIPIWANETRLYQNIFDFLPDKVTILGSSNGLIICRTCIPSPTPSIYICNPVNKQWLNLDWDRTDKKDYFAFSFEPSSIRYNLVRVSQVDVLTPGKEEYYFTFEIYSWEKRVWVKSKEICHCEDSLCPSKQIMIKTTLYWLTDAHTLLIFDIENELSLLISLPVSFFFEDKFPDVCLGESDSVLHCVVVTQEALEVWALEDHFGSKWDLKSFISYEEMQEENKQYLCNFAKRVKSSIGEEIPWMQSLAFKEGILFLRVSNSAYSFNIQTKKVHFLGDMLDLGLKFIGAPIVVPYTVSLLPVINGYP